MPAPKLSRTSFLAFVRDQLVFTHTRLLLDARVAPLAESMTGLLVQWSEVDAEQALGCADFCRCPFSHPTSMNGNRATPRP